MISLKPALPSSSHSPQRYTPNILPCRIAHTGPVDASKRYWCPETSSEGVKTAYFRGRRLVGRSVEVGDGYRGVVVRSTDRIVENTSDDTETSRGNAVREHGHEKGEEFEQEGTEDVDQEEEEEPVRVLEEIGTFEEMVVWGHESLPGEDDIFVKGVGEWLRFAEGIHGFGGTEG